MQFVKCFSQINHPEFNISLNDITSEWSLQYPALPGHPLDHSKCPGLEFHLVSCLPVSWHRSEALCLLHHSPLGASQCYSREADLHNERHI